METTSGEVEETRRHLEAVGGDVFKRRPKHGLLDKAALAWRAWRWPSP